MVVFSGRYTIRITNTRHIKNININNSNIGNVYTIGIRCIDSFRQYVARFRKMEKVMVYLTMVKVNYQMQRQHWTGSKDKI